MVDVGHLTNKLVDVLGEDGRTVVVYQVHINTVFAHQVKRLAKLKTGNNIIIFSDQVYFSRIMFSLTDPI